MRWNIINAFILHERMHVCTGSCIFHCTEGLCLNPTRRFQRDLRIIGVGHTLVNNMANWPFVETDKTI